MKLTASAAAARLGISRERVTQLIRAGRLAAEPVFDEQGSVAFYAIEEQELLEFQERRKERRSP